MNRRSFLTALGSVTAVTAAGLLVPERKIWQVARSAPVRHWRASTVGELRAAIESANAAGGGVIRLAAGTYDLNEKMPTLEHGHIGVRNSDLRLTFPGQISVRGEQAHVRFDDVVFDCGGAYCLLNHDTATKTTVVPQWENPYQNIWVRRPGT